jgi:outer membrane murein-binding lipoprotein Lpp
MQNPKGQIKFSFIGFFALLAACFLAGCATKEKPAQTSTASPAAAASQTMAAAPAPAAAAPAPAPAISTAGAIRIHAGSPTPFTDPDGNVWLPDQGFDGGETVDRGAINVAGTSNPGIYRTEHYSMNSFTRSVPNGKYVVKLHFAETYDGISSPGERVFSVNVNGHAINDIDLLVVAPGAMHAHVETVPVEVTDGKILITFSAKANNSEINGIEIIPRI